MSVNIKLSDLSPALRQQVIEKMGDTKLMTKKLTARKKNTHKESCPQYVLTQALQNRWPEIQAEFEPHIDGRKFSIDLAFPDVKLAIEVDGWQYHGKYKSGFQKDRQRQNLLTIHGWRILRFFYKEIMNEESRGEIIKIVERALGK